MQDKIFNKFFTELYEDDMDPIKENMYFDLMESELLPDSILKEDKDIDVDPELEDDLDEKENNDESEEDDISSEEDEDDGKDPEIEYTKNLSGKEKEERDKKFNLFNRYFLTVKKNVRFDPTLKRYGFHLRRLLRVALVLAGTYILPFGIFAKVCFFIISVMISKKSDLKQRSRLNTLYENKIKYYDDLIEKTNNTKKKFKYRQLRDELKRNQDRLRPYVTNVSLSSNSSNHMESIEINNFNNLFLEADDDIPPVSNEINKPISNEIKSGEERLDDIKSGERSDNNTITGENNETSSTNDNIDSDETNDDMDMDNQEDNNGDLDVSDDNIDSDETNDDMDMDNQDDNQQSEEDIQKKKDEHYLKIKYLEVLKNIRANCTNTINILENYKRNNNDNIDSLNHIINEFNKIEDQSTIIIRDYINRLSTDSIKIIIDCISKKMEILINSYKQLNIQEE